MKAKLRWVFQRAQETGGGAQKPSLCFEGRKWALCVVAGHPVRVLKRPLPDVLRARAVRESQPDGPEYPVERAAERLWEIGSRNGITHAAASLLRQVLEAEGASTEVDEEAIEDEENLEMTKPENTAPVGEQAETPVTTTDGNTPKGDATMSSKSKATKAKAKAPATKATKATKVTKATKTKAPAKERKPRVSHAKLPKRATEGPTPFRAGTAKEKAFLAYKEQAKKYVDLDKEGKSAWVEKTAGKLGVSPGTLRSWISGQFDVALRS